MFPKVLLSDSSQAPHQNHFSSVSITVLLFSWCLCHSWLRAVVVLWSVFSRWLLLLFLLLIIDISFCSCFLFQNKLFHPRRTKFCFCILLKWCMLPFSMFLFHHCMLFSVELLHGICHFVQLLHGSFLLFVSVVYALVFSCETLG